MQVSNLLSMNQYSYFLYDGSFFSKFFNASHLFTPKKSIAEVAIDDTVLGNLIPTIPYYTYHFGQPRFDCLYFLTLLFRSSSWLGHLFGLFLR